MMEPGPRAKQTAMMAEDAYSALLVYIAMALAYPGYIAQARVQMLKAISVARSSGQIYTLTSVLLYACNVEWVVNCPDRVREYSEEALNLAIEHGFPLSVALGKIHRGWALATVGPAMEGFKLVSEGLDIYRSTGAVCCLQFGLMRLAKVRCSLGQSTEALFSLAEAAQIIDSTDERFCESELYRLRTSQATRHGEIRSPA
jgi:hypothetical protein